MTLKDKLKGCLICGAIGDAIGGRYEGSSSNLNPDFDFRWSVSDDTQLTLATCEAIYLTKSIEPEKVAASFLDWYNKRKLSGLGASTLKALRELQVGGHWALVGRSGEYAAGNGAAMRIAPLAFKKDTSRETVRDICTITHKNEEAYTGALAVYYSIISAIKNSWDGSMDLMEIILPELPDTLLKDRIIEMNDLRHVSIQEIGEKFKPSGYVVDSIPLALFAAQKINQQDFKTILYELIKLGGDTDTICSITGQIIGSLKGVTVIPDNWILKYERLSVSALTHHVIEHWKE